MVKLKGGQAILQLKMPLEGARPLSVLAMNQMFIVTTTHGLYQVPVVEPSLRRLLKFQAPISRAILFAAREKIFFLSFNKASNQVKIYSTLKQLQFEFIFKVKLKKFKILKFYSEEKMLVLVGSKRVQLVDIAKLLLRKEKAIKQFLLDKRVRKVVHYYDRENDTGLHLVVDQGELHKVGFRPFILNKEIYVLI